MSTEATTANVKSVFAHLDHLVTAIHRVKKEGYRDFTVTSPLPRHEILDEIYEGEPSPVRWWTLIGGMVGGTGGFVLAAVTSAVWPMALPGGKPVVSVPPFVIITFECTVLIGGLATLLGIIFHARLPSLDLDVEVCDPRYSSDRFGLIVHGMDESRQAKVMTLLRNAGAEEVSAADPQAQLAVDLDAETEAMAPHVADEYEVEHEESPYLAHHFYTLEQQNDSIKLGMWAFLVQEVLFFGGLFMAYISMRFLYPDTFLHAYEHLNIPMGATNTIVLLTSSLTMALAVRAAQTNDNKWLVRHLVLTCAFAFTFMVIKYFEYSHKIHAGLLPGEHYSYTNVDAFFSTWDAPQLFFSVYFMMTGVHGLHVVIGIGVIGWLIMRAVRGDFNSKNYMPVENVGLYWHLVDLIWIFLFPLLYLIK